MKKKAKDIFFSTYLKCLKKQIKERPKHPVKNSKLIGVEFKGSKFKHLNGATFQGRCKIYKNIKKKVSGYSFVHNNEMCVPHSNIGVMNFSDGHTYSGGWKDGDFFGDGSYNNPELGEYYGMWSNGMMNGWGEMKYNNGNMYKGEFKNSKWKGLGTLKTNKGKIYRGYFKDSFELKKGSLIKNYVIQEGEESYTYVFKKTKKNK